MKQALISSVLLLAGFADHINDKPFYAGSGTQLDKTWVMYLLYDHRLVAAVWCDIDFSMPGSCAGDCGNHKAAQSPFNNYNGVRSGDGRLVEWTVDTKNGKAEVAIINGKAFPLADGSLFLVRTRAVGAPITQLKLDLRGKVPDPALWRQLPENNPEVKEFLAEADEK